MTPDNLARKVSGFRQGEGEAWLRRLPGILDECCRRWGLVPGEPFPYPSLSFVAPATREDGTAAVLKVGFLLDELACETGALRAFDGQGAVRLLDADPERGALLLERLSPGTELALLTDEEEVTGIGIAVMRRLWRPAPLQHAFPTVAAWAGGLQGLRERFGCTTGPLPPALVAQAEGLRADLLTSAPEPQLLHGDLQHHNILQAERRPWLAIDPKGVVGDPAYELGPFLSNRLRCSPEPDRYLPRAVARFAEELGLGQERIRGWSLVQAMLSAWWSIEDTGCGWEGAVACAERFAALPG